MRLFAILMTTLAFTLSEMTFSPAQATAPVDGFYNCSTGLASPGPFLEILSGAVVDGGNCTGSVVIPGGVTSIGSYAFFFSSLTTIDIPSSVTTIAGNAFRITTSLTSVTVDGANLNFSSSAGVLFNKLSTTLLTYPSAKSGTSYSIPSSVTSIGDYAFDFAVSPTSIDIPSSVTSIGSYAFSRTSSLTNIVIPANVTSIGMGAFFNATSLNSINIPASVTSLGINVFEGATSLTSVTFESGSPLTSIGNYAFINTSALTSVTIPLGVTSIGNYAFYGGASLSSVYFLGNAPTVGSSAFANVASGAKAYIKTGATGFADVGQTWNGLTVTIWTDFACPAGGGTYQVNSGAVTGTTGSCSGDLTLDSSVTTLDTYAFASAQLSSLTIPAAVTTISGSTFASYGNSSLVSITVAGANPNYSSTDGVLFDKLSTELIVYPASKPGASYTIPSSVTAIRYYGFAGNKFLTSLDIPNTVTNLEGQNFINSESIATINVGTGLANLGEQSFAYIQTLSAINVNPSNTYFASIDGVLYSKDISTLWAYPIGKTATSYTAPNTVTATKYTVFGQASNLLTVDLTSVATLSGQEFDSSTSIREITFGNSLTQLKNQTLQSASGLQKLYLGTGLTTITNGAFWGNTSLNCVVYAGSNPTIQNYAYPNGVVPVANSSCLADSVSSLTPTVTPIIANAYRAESLGTVYFAPLSSKLSTAAKKKIEAAIIANPSAVYKITGYVQKSIFAKNAKNNSSLSLARAKAIETYLVSLGAGVNFTVVVDAGKVPAKNGTSSKARRATLYAMTPVVQ